jgi:hypothetical protein
VPAVRRLKGLAVRVVDDQVNRRRSRSRLVLGLLAVATFLALASSAAYAAWSASASGQQPVATTTVDAPASASAAPVSASSTEISWQPPAAGATPSRYRVLRAGGALVCEQAAPPCSDTGLSPSTAYSYTVQSRVGLNWVSATTATASTTTPTDGSFTLNAAASSAAGTQQTITIEARTGSGALATSYTGTKTLTWSGQAAGSSLNGTAPTLPTSATFTNGSAQVTIVLTRAGTAMALTVSDTSQARHGSASVTVSTATVALALACPPTAARTTNVSITLTRPLTDAYGNPTPDANNVTVTAVNGLWQPNNVATVTVSLAGEQSAITGTLRISGPAGATATTTVSTTAPTGYTAGSCTIGRP